MKFLRARDTPLGTLAQSLGRLPLLLTSMEPTWSFDSLGQLTSAFVADHDIAGVIWDVDGTLTAYHHTDLLPEAAAPFAALRNLPGLRHVILSNAPEWRFRELGTVFPTVPVIRGYALGRAVLARRLVGNVDSWAPEELEARLAGGAVPLRKPNADLVRLAIGELGCTPARVVMVGDQHLTDVAGARLAGIRSIKLPNLGRSSFPWSIRCSQRLEALLYRFGPSRWPARTGRPA